MTLDPTTTAQLINAIFDDQDTATITMLNDTTAVIINRTKDHESFAVINTDALIAGLDAHARQVGDADDPFVAAIKAENYAKIPRLIAEDNKDHIDPLTGLAYSDTVACEIGAQITHAADNTYDLPYDNDGPWNPEDYPEFFK